MRTGFWEDYLGLREMRWRENGESCTMRNFIICSHPQISLGGSSQGEWGGRGMWHTWYRREKCTGFWWEIPKERDHSEDQGVGGRMGSQWILGRLAWGGGVWTGFDWLRIGTGGRLYWVRWWTFGFLRHGVIHCPSPFRRADQNSGGIYHCHTPITCLTVPCSSIWKLY
jgi:hypothetical protein